MAETGYQTERLDHLGIVAGVCREIELAAYLDALDVRQHERVSVGTATVAMILNGLGFSNRRLYLVPQFFANKPVAHLLGPGIQADDLNDDCLGRALDWLYAHDPTALFAGIAAHARKVFGVQARQLHADTTSFAVHGAYEPQDGDLDAQAIAITYGYSRDHRADLKQWMLGLVTTHDGDLSVGMQALDGNASDHESLPDLVTAVLTQLRDVTTAESEGAETLFVADSALYSTTTMQQFSSAQLRWVSRAPETSTEAKAAVAAAVEAAMTASGWQTTDDQTVHWLQVSVTLSPDSERWLVVRTRAGQERARATLARQVAVQQEAWQRTLWHLGNRDFACAPDAQAALTRALQDLPDWLQVEGEVVAQPRYMHKGRPRKGGLPDHLVWRVETHLTLAADAVEREALRRACFLVATNVLDAVALSDETLIRIYTQDQGSVERGFAFLKDPLFLASSVFLKKVLCRPRHLIG
jgi:transposase